ncbi:MAG: hypothetical protein FWD47_15090 [Treponema sp.]|nr:hypothetical protein [Treponema sp.]
MKFIFLIIFIIILNNSCLIQKDEINYNEKVLNNNLYGFKPISQSARLDSLTIYELSILALSGDIQSANKIATHYGIAERNDEKMYKWYLINSENNDSQSQYSIWSYRNLFHDDFILDYERRLFWLFQSRKNDNEFALNYISYEYIINECMFIKEIQYKEKIDIVIDNNNLNSLEIRAMRGNGIISLKLAEYYEQINNEKMVFWLRIGAQNGNKECMIKYGNYLINKNDELNIIRGEFWLQKSMGF